MTKQEYLEFHKEKCQAMMKMTQAKNADYTGGSEDPFANFAQVKKFGICEVEIGFLTRMIDKFCRIISFVKKGDLQVKNESVDDTLMDLANYCVLLMGYLEAQRGESVGADDLSNEPAGADDGLGSDISDDDGPESDISAPPF